MPNYLKRVGLLNPRRRSRLAEGAPFIYVCVTSHSKCISQRVPSQRPMYRHLRTVTDYSRIVAVAKKGCPVCGKVYGAGHWSVSDCPELGMTSEMGLPPLTESEFEKDYTLSEHQAFPKRQVVDTSNLPKNRAWEARNADKYRDYRKLYMREYRTKKRESLGQIQ